MYIRSAFSVYLELHARPPAPTASLSDWALDWRWLSASLRG